VEHRSVDLELLERVKAADVEAFRTLFERYQPILFRNVLVLTRNADQAHDVVQEIFVRVWEHRSRLKPTLGFLAYALSIGRNLVRDAARHQRIRERSLPAIPPPARSEGDDPDEALAAGLLREKLLEVIRRDLPERCREIFLLSRIEQKSNAEIAALLGLSVKTVENQIGHALKILRKKL
jgi:RNA polymerase sigma-70 factor (ECF subfamily)